MSEGRSKKYYCTWTLHQLLVLICCLCLWLLLSHHFYTLITFLLFPLISLWLFAAEMNCVLRELQSVPAMVHTVVLLFMLNQVTPHHVEFWGYFMLCAYLLMQNSLWAEKVEVALICSHWIWRCYRIYASLEIETSVDMCWKFSEYFTDISQERVNRNLRPMLWQVPGSWKKLKIWMSLFSCKPVHGLLSLTISRKWYLPSQSHCSSTHTHTHTHTQ